LVTNLSAPEHSGAHRGTSINGVRWFPSRPPIEGLEFEVDLRGVARELML